MNVMTLNSEYQLTLPKELREREKWEPGQKFVLIERLDGLSLVRVPEREELFGIAKGANTENYRDRDDRY
jgi:bifunctional DNA-binding transcriptional regulator/antitoxin component of YhaV-PrlF toxin-antitoxin module